MPSPFGRPSSSSMPSYLPILVNGDEGTSCALALRAAIVFVDAVLFAYPGKWWPGGYCIRSVNMCICIYYRWRNDVVAPKTAP